MRLGLLTVVFYHLPLETALDRIKAEGIDTIELGTGNYPGKTHCDPDRLLEDPGALEALCHQLRHRGLKVSALACHGNPLHPDRTIAAEHHRVFEQTVRLASRIEVDRITLFSGCPGGSPADTTPNWVTCAWPRDYQDILEWQWSERVVPYWKQQVDFAKRYGVTRLCFEMHPGFVVYNPASLLRLRGAIGEAVGANFDPSHLFWQGIDVIEAVRILGRAGAIHHVHAKDVAMNNGVMRLNGVLDTTPLDRIGERAWIFRTVGYGHDALFWRQFGSALREVGYDDVVSIEHEDALASPEEGVTRAVELLRNCLLSEPPAQAWWA